MFFPKNVTFSRSPWPNFRPLLIVAVAFGPVGLDQYTTPPPGQVILAGFNPRLDMTFDFNFISNSTNKVLEYLPFPLLRTTDYFRVGTNPFHPSEMSFDDHILESHSSLSTLHEEDNRGKRRGSEVRGGG